MWTQQSPKSKKHYGTNDSFWMDGFQWASAQLLKYKGRKKEKNWSHIEWWWSSPFFVNPLCSFSFQWSFFFPKDLCVCLKAKIVEPFFQPWRICTLNPTYPKVPFLLQIVQILSSTYISGNMFWMGVIMMMKVNNGCVTHCGLAIYIIKYH